MRTLTVAALGIVFGDIGTSPLYALRECFSGAHAVPASHANILGVVSLLLWVVILVVCLKYVVLVLRADNNGEGGILALMTLVDRTIGAPATRFGWMITSLGILGAALLYGDGIITPAISVLSAIEGIETTSGSGASFFHPYIVPCAVAVLVGLFLVQRKGTHRIGVLFGPVLVVWFLIIGFLGLVSIVKCPSILKAISPVYAVRFFLDNGWHAFLLMGTVFLAVTGAEVMYADMGHFGKRPIRAAWAFIVMPALMLNYLGQGAYVLRMPGQSPGELANLFFKLCPVNALLYPLVVLATVATIIASQAVISGMFSLARQAVQLGFWPRLRVIHTSPHVIGQVYLPFINITLGAGTILLVLGFGDSSKLASAYGIAVSGTMFITTVLVLFVLRSYWHVPRPVVILVGLVFLVVDGSFLASNMMKLLSGGWIVVAVSITICILMSTWRMGRKLLQRDAVQSALSLNIFADDIAKNGGAIRVPGTAVFLTGTVNAVPRALLHNLKHNLVLHKNTIILTVLIEDVPYIAAKERIATASLGCGIFSVSVRCGFSETLHVPDILASIHLPGVNSINQQHTTYFLGKESIVVTERKTIPVWRKILFSHMARNSLTASAFFGLPPNRVVELGMQVEI